MTIAYNPSRSAWFKWDPIHHYESEEIEGCVLQAAVLSTYRVPETSCIRGLRLIAEGIQMDQWPGYTKRTAITLGEPLPRLRSKDISYAQWLMIEGSNAFVLEKK